MVAADAAPAARSGRSNSRRRQGRRSTPTRCHPESTSVKDRRRPSWVGERSELLDAEHRVAEGPQLRVDERLVAAIAAPALDGVPVGFGRAAVTSGSAIQEDLDVLFGRELASEVLAETDLVASHDEVVPGHDCHSAIFYETRVGVKIGE